MLNYGACSIISSSQNIFVYCSRAASYVESSYFFDIVSTFMRHNVMPKKAAPQPRTKSSTKKSHKRLTPRSATSAAQALAPEHRLTRRTRQKYTDGLKPTVEARLLSAMERLLEKGHRFAALSVEQLAKEAGMARGTFYLHFRDKAELVTRLMRQVTDEIVLSTGGWFSDAENARRKDVRNALVGMVQTFKKHQAIIAAINDTAPYDKTVAALYAEMVETICAQSRHSVAALRRRKRGRKGNTDDVADVLSGMVILYCARFVGEREGAALDRLARSLGHISSVVAFADSEDRRD